jgi:RNA polymerase sigma-70 factor (ECF subfamily)
MSLRECPPGSAGLGDEEQLVDALRARSPAAFESLVRSHGGAMLAAARRLLRSEEDARDAVQDALLSAFRSIDDFQGTAKLSTWLKRIVVNAALMKLRTRQRKSEQPIEDLLPTFAEDGHTAHSAIEWRGGEERLQRRQLCDVIQRCIDQLPESYRMVLILRDIEDLDTEQTAQLMGLSPGAVKVRLHRARLGLRGLLDPHMREGSES